MIIRDYLEYINTTQIHRVAVVLFIVLLGVGMGVGFSVASSARKDADADYSRRLAIFSQWQMDLTSHFTKAGSLAATIGSFAASAATGPANMSAPSAARMMYHDPGYQRLCRNTYVAGVTAMVLAPGGVNSQFYPPNSTRLGQDILAEPTYKQVLPLLLNTTQTVITGPNKFTSRPGSGMLFWFPIHVADNISIVTFWGTAFVVVEVDDLTKSMQLPAKAKEAGLDYAIWYTTTETGTTPTVIAQTDAMSTDEVIAAGMRMQLPISQAGRSSYLAMYPKGGPVSHNMKVSTAVIVVIATVLGAAVVVLILYLLAYAHFLYRHRRAPASHSTMYVAALALRGAQPIADRAPLVAVQMFNDFNSAVRKLAFAHGCYPICEIGDRCVYVASTDQDSIIKLAQAAVLDVTVRGSIPNVESTDARTPQAIPTRSPSVSVRSVSYARTTTHATKTAITSQISEEMTQSSFIGASICHPSVACHTMSAMSVYDAARDVYFFGSAVQLGKLCGALDLAKCGEVCWTDAFEQKNPQLCRGAASAALTSHMVSENGEVVLHVASWWKESGDERDNEDPSTAMAVLSDAYVRRMTVIVSEGKAEAKERKRKGGDGETRSGSSNKSNEATALTRTATLLHVAIISGDEKNALEVVRKIVTEEKGAVVSAHESTIVAAFNLLSAGGHHQVRAADTVMRLRDALPSTHFACSIQHGKVGALIMDGLVMCTGEAVTQGRQLLQMAVSLADDSLPSKMIEGSKRRSAVGPGSGLCLLCCHSELSSTYDCEAVDVTTLGQGKAKIIYRLAYRQSGKATDDEWMYCLKDDEDHSPFALVNAVFARIASHELDEAARLWREQGASSSQGFEISKYAKASVARHLNVNA